MKSNSMIIKTKTYLIKNNIYYGHKHFNFTELMKQISWFVNSTNHQF